MSRYANVELRTPTRRLIIVGLAVVGIALTATATAQNIPPQPQQSPAQRVLACQQACAKTQKTQKAYQACRRQCVEEANTPKPAKEPR